LLASLKIWCITGKTLDFGHVGKMVTYLQWEDSPDPEGTQLGRPQLPSPRRMPVSPLRPPESKNKRRRARKWCLLEEETLRKGVKQYVILFCPEFVLVILLSQSIHCHLPFPMPFHVRSSPFPFICFIAGMVVAIGRIF
jgi:hypothetical protein